MKKYLFLIVTALFFVSCSNKANVDTGKTNKNNTEIRINTDKKVNALSKENIKNQEIIELFKNKLSDFKKYKEALAEGEALGMDISKYEDTVKQGENQLKADLEFGKSQGLNMSSWENLEKELEEVIQISIKEEEYINPSITYDSEFFEREFREMDEWKFVTIAKIVRTETKDGAVSFKFKGCDGATLLMLEMKDYSKKLKRKEDSLYPFMCYSNGTANLKEPRAYIYRNKHDGTNKMIVNGEHYKIENIP